MKTLTIKEYEKITGVHITVNHTGKMEYLESLSTACTTNNYCEKMHSCGKKDCICTKCYAQAMSKKYTALNKALEKNTEILTKSILEYVPIIPSLYFRFNAFGELNNVIELINYFNIAKANKNVHFALWTKRPEIIAKAIAKGYTKPNNLRIVISSPMINKPKDISKYDFADKVFTVYNCNFAIENNIKINCGSASCMSCGKCYNKNKVTEICEMLKSEQKKYNKLTK